MLRWICGVTRKDRIRNQCAYKRAQIQGKTKQFHLRWFWFVLSRLESTIAEKLKCCSYKVLRDWGSMNLWDDRELITRKGQVISRTLEVNFRKFDKALTINFFFLMVLRQ